MRIRGRFFLGVFALAVVLAVSVGSAGAAPPPKKGKVPPVKVVPKPVKPATTTIAVKMFDFGFTLSQQSAPRGTVIFNVVNVGKAPHDFLIGKYKTPELQEGQSATLTAQFPAKGSFTYICTVEGHVEQGMIGRFSVS